MPSWIIPSRRAEYAAARGITGRSLAIDERALAPEHPTTRIIRANLAARDAAAQPAAGRLPTV